jgi:hypothetical protein
MGLMEKANVIGAVLACAIFVVVSFVLIARLAGKPRLEHGLGLALMMASIPLLYLLVVGPSLKRPAIFYLQVGLMLAYLIIELLLDYILKVEFRKVRWMVIAYTMIFFSGTGGMIGVASLAGRIWTILAVVLFLAMTVLAFVQHAVTGMI